MLENRGRKRKRGKNQKIKQVKAFFSGIGTKITKLHPSIATGITTGNRQWHSDGEISGLEQ